MSYILDALRKSDQQRLLGAAPSLLTAQATTLTSRRPAYWIYGVFGVILIGTGIVIGWLRPWQLVQPVAGTVTAKSVESDPRPIASVAPGPAASEVDGKPGELPARQSPAEILQAPVPTNSVLTKETPAVTLADAQPRSPSSGTAAAVAKDSALPTSARPAELAGRAGAVPAGRVLGLSELPPGIRQEIPPMSISVHAYSARPHDRLVGINDRMLREGGSLPPGLTLDEITPDGMIFSYKGYRFKRELP